MATDIKIDYHSRDFVDDGAGGWVEVDDSSTAVLCQIECEEGAWWGDFFAGSQNAAILRSDLPTADDIEISTKRALAALAQAGMISNVTVEQDTNASDTANGLGLILCQWLDRHTNKPADLAYSPLGGNPAV